MPSNPAPRMASQDSRNVRQLLPAPQGNTLLPDIASRPTHFDLTSTIPPRKRGKQVGLACDACKRRKSKCDGRRPICVACERKSTDCHYDELGRENNKVATLKIQVSSLNQDLQEKVEVLRSLIESTHEDAHELLDTYRKREQIDVLSDSAKSGPENASTASGYSFSSDSPSLTRTARLVDDTERQDSYDRSEGSAGDSVTQIRTSGKLELFHLARQAGWLEDVACSDTAEGEQLKFSVTITNQLAPRSQQPFTPIIRQIGFAVPTFQPLEQHQPFLDLEARQWTTVIDDDALFSRLICLWVSHHATCMPYVYPTLIVESLAAGKPTEHCTRLLVNAILAVACQYSTALPTCGPRDHPALRGFRFYNEALELWQAEDCRPSIPTAQALVAMYEFNKMRGKDRVGWDMLHSAVDMIVDLGICKCPNITENTTSEQSFARRFAAWGIYNFQATESLIFCKLPLLRRCFATRIYGALRPFEATEKWRPFGIVAGVKLDSCFWEHWNALCSLSDIVVDTTHVLFADERDGFRTPNFILVQQVDGIMAKLNSWQSQLPSVLNLDKNEMPHNLWLHTIFYNLVVKLHQPERSFADAECSKHSMVNAAKAIIQLARISSERYGYEYRSVHDSQVCAAAAFALVHDLSTESSRCTLLECAEMLHAQAGRFLLPGALSRSILLWAKAVGPSWADITSALATSMTFDYLTSKKLQPPTQALRQAHSALAGFVSSKFPSTISDLRENFGELNVSGGAKLDEVLANFDGTPIT